MMDLVIADTCLRTCADLGRVEEIPDATYREFRRADGADGVIGPNIRLVAGALPDTRGMERVFSTGETWDLMRAGEDVWIVMRSPAMPGEALWVAHLDREVNHITVHLGDRFVRGAGESRVLFSPVSYPLDQILLVMHLASRSGLLLHAAGMVYNGRAYVFPGRCSAGKSTVTRLFTEQGAHFLSDDRIVIRKTGTGYRAYGTPWPGDAGVARNEGAPLAGIYFLTQALVDRISPLGMTDAVARLLPVTSIPWQDRDLADQAMATCDALLRFVPTFDCCFRVGPGIVTCLHDFVGAGAPQRAALASVA